MILRNEQNQRYLQQCFTPNSHGRLAFQFGNREVDLLLFQQPFRHRLIGIVQAKFQMWESPPMPDEQRRQMIPQDGSESSEPQPLRRFPAQALRCFLDARKEWCRKFVKLATGRRKLKGPPLE